MRAFLEHRVLLSVAMAGIAGVSGLRTWPFPVDHVVLALIQAERPGLSACLAYSYATLWFSTPFFALNIACSMVAIFLARFERVAAPQALPPYPRPEQRRELCLV